MIARTGIIASSLGYSAEAQSVFDNISAAGGSLTVTEKDAIAKYVDSEVAVGNFAKRDEIQCPALSDSTAKRAGWKGIANATGGVDNTKGIRTNSGPIATNIILSSLTQYTLNDSTVEVYSYSNASSGNDQYLWRCEDATHKTSLRQSSTNSRLEAFFNSTTLSTELTESSFAGLSLYGIRRKDSLTFDFMKNGVQTIQRNIGSTGVPTVGLNIGTGGIDVVASFIAVGAAVGVDYVSHNTHLNTLLTDLGI